MDYVNLGRTGLRVSRIVLGCMTYGDPEWRPWILDEEEARGHFRRALELGVNFFDTADMYSKGRSEEVTGRLLGEMVARDEVVVASKVFFPTGEKPNQRGLSRKHVLAACDASLRRLGMDHIDLYYIHRLDPHTPVEETLSALDSLVRAGKVRYLGASSMAAWQFARALAASERHGWHRFVAMQNHYNLAYREEEREMIPLCIAEGVGVVPWSPLARGFLTGSRTRSEPRTTRRAQSDPFADELYFTEDDFNVLDALLEVSRARGAAPAQVALAWLLSVPGVVAPVVGSTKIEHIEDAVAAAGIVLHEEEIAKLEEPYRPHPVLGHKQPTPRRMGESGASF